MHDLKLDKLIRSESTKCKIEGTSETTSISINQKYILITLKNGQNRILKQNNLMHINDDDFYLMNSEHSFNSFYQAALHSGTKNLLAALNQQEEVSALRCISNFSCGSKVRKNILSKEESKRNKSEKVKFFRWHPHLEKILIASENYVKVWDLKKNLEYEFQIEIKTTTKVEIKNVKWNEKGNRIIVTTNEKILIFNDRLNLDTTINQSLSEETILIDENHLFVFGTTVSDQTECHHYLLIPSEVKNHKP